MCAHTAVLKLVITCREQNEGNQWLHKSRHVLSAVLRGAQRLRLMLLLRAAVLVLSSSAFLYLAVAVYLRFQITAVEQIFQQLIRLTSAMVAAA